MNKRRMWLLSVAILVAVTASGCGYNTLQSKQQNVKAKWAGVETQLQRRSDLIKNMIETAKLAGVQEQEVFGTIAKSNSALINAQQAAPQGEGGDKTLVIDAEAEARVFQALQQLHDDGARFTVVLPRRTGDA